MLAKLFVRGGDSKVRGTPSLEKKRILLFTDASVSPQSGLGVGASLVVEAQDLYDLDPSEIASQFEHRIHFEVFSSNKSTFVEIRTAMNAVKSHILEQEGEVHVNLYTDCQSLCDLLNHRLKKLVTQGYTSGSGHLLAHAELYAELFQLSQTVSLTPIKMDGHVKLSISPEEKIFSFLDKSVRKKLRKHVELNIWKNK